MTWKVHKIVDTIENFGSAEKYLVFDSDFERFIKGQYPKHKFLETNQHNLVKKYNLKGIVFGNYVTQEERFHFIFKIKHQLETLALISGTSNIGKGKLIVAFGAEGKAQSAAHYNPTKQLINLNRGRLGSYKNVLQGENSFLHEYGHFIDFLTGRSNGGIPVNFASEYRDNMQGKPSDITKNFSKVAQKLFEETEYVERLKKETNWKYLSSPTEMFARLYESALTHFVMKNYKSKRDFFGDEKYKGKYYLSDKKIVDKGLERDIIKITKLIPRYQ